MLLFRLHFLLLACLLFAFSPALHAQAPAPPVRQRVRMDAGWRFLRMAPSTPAHASAVTSWRWRPGLASEASQTTLAALDTSGPDWKDAPTGQDTFNGRVGFAWYRAHLPPLAFPHRVLHFESVDDNATVYLNGVKLMHHEGWNDPFDVPLDTAWNTNGPNAVTVLVENTSGQGGIMGAVTLGTLTPQTDEAAFVQPGFNDHAWRVVHLPHDYVVEGTFDPNGDASHAALPTPRAWYRKTFTLPASDQGKSVWIDFDGVYRDAKVYLNGQMLGEHPGGYDAFRYDISRYAHFGGANVLAVSVDPTHHEGWWYEGGGIYRHVWLNVAAPAHIAPWGVFVSTKMPEPGADGIAASAIVTVKTAIDYPAGFSENAAFMLVSRVYDAAGRLIGATDMSMHSSFAQQTAGQEISVAHPQLWSLETPRLYTLRSELVQNGKVIDTQDTPFGIRTIRFDAQKGFFLNGKPVKIKGTCNHQDFAGVGIGMPDSLLYWRIKKLKEMGSNAYRMSHNPPTAELLDACDKLGMLVMDENRHLGDTEASKSSLETPYSNLSELKSMILRDRNHPSIIMWSMCNEEGIQGSPQAAAIFTAMMKVVNANDGTRPITCAMNGGYFSPDGITSVEDLQGINYSPGNYDTFHNMHPNMPLYGSETSSEVGTRGVYGPDTFKIDGITYLGDQVKGYISAYDLHAPPWAGTAEAAWKPIADRPYVAGGYVWTGFDYKGEPTPFGWPDINSNFGAMDECGFPKDAYYYYQSVWGDRPMVHVFPHWNWAGKEGQPIDVWAYSNTDSVELFLNGKSLGVQEMPKNGHVHWSVPYAPGTLEARGLRGGQIIATDTVQTTGVPAALKLTTDRTRLSADGEDVTMVEVDVVDAQGRIVPTAGNLVTFTLTGAGNIAGVGNGDPSSHEPDQGNSRSAFGGKCLVIIGADGTPGTIHLKAAAPGLQSASLALRSVPAKP